VGGTVVVAIVLLLLVPGCRSSRPERVEAGPVERRPMVVPPAAVVPPPVVPEAPRSELDLADEAWEHGDLELAMHHYRAVLETGAEGVARALFRVGSTQLVPSGPDFDPASGRRALRRVLSEYPDSAWALEAALLLDLQDEVKRLEEQLEEIKRIDLERRRRPPG
jgi:hypothetical protein